jgi:hypothetical protein
LQQPIVSIPLEITRLTGITVQGEVLYIIIFSRSLGGRDERLMRDIGSNGDSRLRFGCNWR